MRVEEFNEILNKSLNIVHVGIEKGYFKEEDKENLINKLVQVLKNGVARDISGTAIYGAYSSAQKRLYYNAKVFKDDKEALIYILHEMKHALDDNELSIGFDLKSEENGVGMNEGATQRFATDIAEEILGEKIPETMQSSLGITLSTNLDEYQIEDKMNELFCKALGISRAEFLRMQNENNLESINTLKQRFNEFADFEAFEKALDGIYAIQEETWFDENGNSLEQEAEPTPEQTARAKELIRQCQNQILQFVEKSNPEKLEDIKGEMIMIDGEIMNNQEMLYQEDYLKYQNFIMQGYDFGEKSIVYISGTEDYKFSDEWGGITGRLNNGDVITQNIWFRDKNEYKKAKVTFNRDGVIEVSEEENVMYLDEISKEIKASETLGNPEEYLKILELQGRMEDVRKVRQQYEYYMNNRDRIEALKVSDPDLDEEQKRINELADMLYNDSDEDIIIGEDGRIIGNGEEVDIEGVDVASIETNEGEIVYKGITINISGDGVNEYGKIMMQIPNKVIESIELAVEQGQLVLTDAQRQTLLKAKQKPQDKEVSEKDFQEVAENNIGEKDAAFNALKLASQEPEKDNNIQSQGE